MRDEQEPVECHDGQSWDADSKSYRHPAFAQIRASRITGNGQVLYGSDFEHGCSIAITICRSELMRSLARDWHHGGKELIEVRMSEAQWATFISTPNSGSGTPCTIDHVGGAQAPGIKLRHEREVVEKELDARIKRVADHLTEAINRAEQNLAGLSKAKRDELLSELRRAQREVADSLPFAAKSFSEHIEATVESAKVEIEAHMHAQIQRAGLQALGSQLPLRLDEKQPQRNRRELPDDS